MKIRQSLENPTPYKGFMITKYYGEDETSHNLIQVYYGVPRSNPADHLLDVYKSLEDAKHHVDSLFSKQQASKQFAESIKQEKETARVEEQALQLRIEERIRLDVEKTLHKIQKDFSLPKGWTRSKIHSIGLYYHDGKEQKKITISHLEGKKYLVKNSRKSAKPMYLSELRTFLISIMTRFDTGRWY